MFTAGHARECAPKIKTTPISKRYMKCGVSRVECITLGEVTQLPHRTTYPLCDGIKKDLLSLWLNMTLATRLTLARSTR